MTNVIEENVQEVAEEVIATGGIGMRDIKIVAVTVVATKLADIAGKKFVAPQIKKIGNKLFKKNKPEDGVIEANAEVIYEDDEN